MLYTPMTRDTSGQFCGRNVSNRSSIQELGEELRAHTRFGVFDFMFGFEAFERGMWRTFKSLIESCKTMLDGV